MKKTQNKDQSKNRNKNRNNKVLVNSNKAYAGNSTVYISKPILFMMFGCLILILGLRYLQYLHGPFLYYDEMGYWTNAAIFAGKDWTSIGDTDIYLPWYSYGYSIILTPLFWLFSSMETMYRSAVMMNYALIVVIAVCAFYMAKKLLGDTNEIFLLLISFYIACSSANLFQANIAWSEVYLYTATWVLLILLWNYIEKPSYVRMAVLSAFAGFCYVIHNRSLAIVAAIFLFVLVLLLLRKIPAGHVLCAFVVLAVVLVADHFIKAYLIGQIHQVEAVADNTVEGVMPHVRALFTLKGMRNFVFLMIGQLWYSFAASFSLTAWGFAALVLKVYQGIREKNADHKVLFSGAVLAAAGLLLAESSVFLVEQYDLGVDWLFQKYGWIRMDPLIYGRYFECLSGIIAIIGIGFLIEETPKKVGFIGRVIIAAGVLSAAALCYVFSIPDQWFLNTPCVPGIYYFHLFFSLPFSFSLIVWCTLVAVLCTVFILFIVSKNGKRKILLSVGFLLFLLAFNVVTAVITTNGSTLVNQREFDQYADVIAYFETRDEDYPVLCDAGYRVCYDYQTRIIDHRIVYTDGSNLTEIEEDCFIIVPDEHKYEMEQENLYYLTTFENTDVLFMKSKTVPEGGMRYSEWLLTIEK